MSIKKAGCILIDFKNKKIGLIYRPKYNDYSFAKGHLEQGETLQECAIREVAEETGYVCHIMDNKEIGMIKYDNLVEKDIECYFYLAIMDKKTGVMSTENDGEIIIWKSLDEVENALSYNNLKEFWKQIRDQVENLLNNVD